MKRFGRREEVEPPAQASAPTHVTGPRLRPDQQRVAREIEAFVLDAMKTRPIQESMLGLLQVGLPHLAQRDCSEAAIVAGQTAARLGYFARCGEHAMFAVAQEPADELLDALAARLEGVTPDPSATQDAVADLAADLVLAEPMDAQEGARGPFWSLPGAGGEARVALRDRLARALRGSPDVSLYELRRTWMYGYFLRALQECFEDEDISG